MRILGLDTATRATAVALLDTDPSHRLELERRDDPKPGQRPGHATHLMVMAAELLEAAGLRWADLDRIAVGLGPGTFTGLRIGIATARGLAQAQGTPIVGVSTLRSLAMNYKNRGAPHEVNFDAVTAVLDARRGEAFAAAWPAGRAADEEPLLAAAVFAPEQLASAVGALHGSCLAIGDGAVEFRPVLERSGASVPEDGSELHRVTAINHCRLATGLQPSDPDEIRPDYLRLPDAEIALRAARKQ